jgi:DNA primase
MLAAAIRHKDAVIICEGEWDALLTIQHGFTAITRTGAAHVWDPEWNEYFRGLSVYLCHDRDTAGQAGNRIVKNQIKSVVKSVSEVELPYPITEKHGKDLTDFFMNGGSRHKLESLLEASRWSE